MTVVPQVQADGKWVSAPEGAKPERWRARTKFRDSDGKLRDVERFDTTKAKAVARLKAALTERATPSAKGAGGLRVDMSVRDAGELWLSQVERSDGGLAPSTRRQYRDAFVRHVEHGKVCGLSLREANRVPVLRTFLQGVADAHGTGSAKTARSVLSGILGMAVQDGVLNANAMRDVRPAKARITRTTDRNTERAFTREEREAVMATADASPRAVDLDVADIVAFMAGTGVRISEALAQRWDDVDTEAGIVRVRGTKTAKSDRVLSVPAWLSERLAARADVTGREGLVFPSPGISDNTRPRDRRNVARVMREVLDAAGCPWATPHTFRRTVVTLIDQAGLSLAEAADYLGHADASMTARVYLGRKATSTRVAAVL